MVGEMAQQAKVLVMQGSVQSLEFILEEKNQVPKAVLQHSDRHHGVCTLTLIFAHGAYDHTKGTKGL